MNLDNKRSFAFVLPRYFDGIVGGAETLCGNLARKLVEGGAHIEIFTTCANDNRTWENHYEEGLEIINNIKVHRFLVDNRNLDSWIPKQIAISQGMRLSIDNQLDWIKEGVNSLKLYKEILTRKDDFEYFFFAPYLFSTTFWGSNLLKEKAILLPCLHDETYAYLDIIASMFRNVKGAIFNAIPEKNLAEKLYGRYLGEEVGMGFETFTDNYLENLKSEYNKYSPYILYMGRKEGGKNVHLLIDYFIQAKEKNLINPNLNLIIAGGGSFKDLDRDSALKRKDVFDIGHLSEVDKHALIKNALVLCQPSTNESFSIVIMEAWLLGVPCLVHSECDVTRYHAEESGGGLYFKNMAEFSKCVSNLYSSPELTKQLAASGYSYVVNNYNWQHIINKFMQILNSKFSE